MSNFFNNNDAAEPRPKKKKKNEKPPLLDPDDSLKFFKTIRTKSSKAFSSSQPSTSNAATNFIDDSTKKSQPSVPKPRAKAKQPTKRKPKAQPDIRKVLSQQELMFNQIVTENCLQEGTDPEEMQLALAISESLRDQQRSVEEEPSTSSDTRFENPFIAMGKVQPISSVLERFGFKSKTNYSEYELDLIANSKVTKRSKFQKFPTMLTRTSQDKRNEMIRIKIDAILEIQPTCEPTEFDSVNEFTVFSFYLQELQEVRKTTFAACSEDRKTDEVLMNYYITELVEPSFTKAGHLLKDWSKIPGREPTPERNSLAFKPKTLEADVAPLTEPAFAIEETNDEESKKVNNEDEKQSVDEPVNTEKACEMDELDVPLGNSSRMSCSDIFADVEDFDVNACFSEEENEKCVDEAEDLADHLDDLQAKLSQSLVAVEKITDATETIPETIIILSGSSESTQSGTSQKQHVVMETIAEDSNTTSESLVVEIIENPDVVDLTIREDEISADSNLTIPYDDSYYSLQQHLKKVESANQMQLKQQQHIFPEVEIINSPIETTLVSSDEEMFEENGDHESSILDPPEDSQIDEKETEGLSQNSSFSTFTDDDDVIEISDEEINYSMRRFHKQEHQLDEGEEETENVDLTQVGDEADVVFSQPEKLSDQSLGDVLSQNEVVDINDTVSNLLETSVCTSNLNISKHDQSMKFFQDEGLSDSLQDIMARYGSAIETKATPKSFRKMQSESQLVNDRVKRRRTVRFSIDEDIGSEMIDLTQHFEDDEAKENSILNISLHKSLDKIMSFSPLPSRKSNQRKSRPKKSLGVQLDDDYLVDTESVVPEPEFRNMTPVELKQALFKYGIRTLPVKKAISLLEFIYDQLHPKIQAQDEEIDVNDSRRNLNITDIASNIGMQDDDAFVFQPGLVEDDEFVLPKVRRSKVRMKINSLNPLINISLHSDPIVSGTLAYFVLQHGSVEHQVSEVHPRVPPD